ncbi:MAG TPA: DUF1800 domain-containing protein [Myxococcaceae bacterium]|nr:DUF1800 domain-containing protein [Myxococcaceae bacterium]
MRFLLLGAVLLLGCATASPGTATAPASAAGAKALQLPAVQASNEQQAVHVLDRLAYGPSPADLRQVEEMGPAAWIAWQLRPADIDDSRVDRHLADFPSLRMSTAELVAEYPRARKVAAAKGVSIEGKTPEALRAELAGVVDPFHLPRQVGAELIAARLIRATESRRQLQETLVDFWFNHFNVSADKGAVRWMVSPYEREAIRPHLFGSFRDLLGAVAHHPAMLFYLDNWMSTREGFSAPKRGRLGLNENYARELLELHTLGVDGGYTQADVREVARCFTGWGIRKPNEEGTFEFHPAAHDRGAKRVLGHDIAGGGGMEDGERVLDLLATHPSTAHFLARKLAQKFVMDSPPPELVERVAQVFLRTNGDLTATYRALFESPEFWSDTARGSKVKTPLEFTVSAVRALGGTTAGDLPMVQALNRMGQPPYRAQPPTGWPEVAQPWVNPGALVARIDFGLRLASGRLTGTEVPLPPVDGTPDEVVDRIARAVLHRPLGSETRATVLAAVGVPEGMTYDERRPVDAARLVGLLLGSPEFQKQ